MSERAQQQYQERAEQHGITDIPPLLNGEPLMLGSPAEAIPVHMPELAEGSGRLITLREALSSLHSFILDTAPDDSQYPKNELPRTTRQNDRFTSQIVGRLLVPKATKAGKITGLKVEALARDEVADSVINRIKYSPNSNFMVETTDIYIGIKGQLSSGSRRSSVGGVICAGAVRMYCGTFRSEHGYGKEDRYSTVVTYRGIPLRGNEQAARWMQQESARTSDAVREHNLRHTYRT